MNDSWLTSETLWRAVDVLSRRPENRNKALEELITLAARAILQSKQIAMIEAYQSARKELELLEFIDEEQMARLVITRERNNERRLDRFRAFVKVLGTSDKYPWLMECLVARQWPKGRVSLLQEHFKTYCRRQKKS